ncbi:hypothetical protein [Geothrix fuzhouensis]|uniref:hypothetical protein n=1 Tax=Geothrix fuzhouensis TaxID=2966451 RepID=UPI002148EA06|nr:hypothetical protein [Geothrix fuzhouensis]
MVENLKIICGLALAISVVISFFYHVKNVGFISAAFWALLPFRLRYLWPAGTEYDRIDDNIPGWVSLAQHLSLIGLFFIWILPK